MNCYSLTGANSGNLLAGSYRFEFLYYLQEFTSDGADVAHADGSETFAQLDLGGGVAPVPGPTTFAIWARREFLAYCLPADGRNPDYRVHAGEPAV